MTGKYNDIATLAQVLTLKCLKYSDKAIIAKTGVSRATILRIYKTALSRGYEPTTNELILNKYVEDAPKSGAPQKATVATEEAIIAAISKNSTTRELSCQRIADAIEPIASVSPSTVHRVLKRRNYRSCKPTTKPGLTAENKLTRLKWCKDHADWTLEDWKNVIWSDETSVTMGGQRGRRRVWRLQSEAYLKHCIRRRWKGFKQFMFWGCFSYDKKGPCHI